MLNPESSSMPVNGEAVQQVLLARAFHDLGYEVSTVVHAFGDDLDETIDGIHVVSAYKWNAGLPVVRFLHPRATGVMRALTEVDADIYFESPAGVLTGLTAAFCRWKKRKFVFRVVSDVDCIPGKQLIKYWRDRKIYEYGLRRASLIAVQSRRQQELLRAHYGLESSVVNMATELPKEEPVSSRAIDVLWISNLNPVKRADRVLAIAKSNSSVNFTMIGGVVRGQEAYYDRMEREAREIPNVHFMGKLSYKETNEYIARSKLFLNTSDIEGFPNTFLQAWVRAVPVVSSLDPNDLIVRAGLGIKAITDKSIGTALRELLENEERREQMGAAARSYALENFSPAASARSYVEFCSI
jgi:glycosyltransferase involved in cell wall biosynthesis